MSEKTDVFNPEYAKRKKFIQKDNIKKIFIMSIIILLMLHGARDYIYGKIIMINIYNLNYKNVDNIKITKDFYNIYYVENSSPYVITLEFNIKINTNYNNEYMLPYEKKAISFSYNGEIGYLKIEGVRVI